jgi:thymidine kinase
MDPEESELYRSFRANYLDGPKPSIEHMNALKVPLIAERALVYLFAEQNLLSAEQTRLLVDTLDLDREYLTKRLSDNKRPLAL